MSEHPQTLKGVKILTWTWSKSDQNMSRTWQVSVYISFLICQHQFIFSLLAMKAKMTINSVLSTTLHKRFFLLTMASFFHSGENVVINLIEKFSLDRTVVISIFRPSFIWDFSAMTWPLWLTPRESWKLDISFTFVKRQPVYYSESRSFWHCIHYKFFDEFVNKNKKKL